MLKTEIESANVSSLPQMYLIVNGKRMKKKKSSLGKSGDPKNPIWNEAFTFNFSQSNLHNAALEVSETQQKTIRIQIDKNVLILRFTLFHPVENRMRLEVVELDHWNMVWGDSIGKI